MISELLLSNDYAAMRFCCSAVIWFVWILFAATMVSLLNEISDRIRQQNDILLADEVTEAASEATEVDDNKYKERMLQVFDALDRINSSPYTFPDDKLDAQRMREMIENLDRLSKSPETAAYAAQKAAQLFGILGTDSKDTKSN